MLEMARAPAEVVPRDARRRGFLAPVFAVLFAALALEASHEIFGFAGSGYSNLVDSYLYDAMIGSSGLLMVARGVLAPRERAWMVIGIGTLLWMSGDIVWDINFGNASAGHVPRISVSDAFWLSWYPFAAIGIVILVRSRLRGFDLSRWIDGIALALLVATPGVALALQPAIDDSHLGMLAHVVLVAYPACDILLLGAALGVIALAGWRPGRSWYTLSLGLSAWVIADALYSVQQIKGTYASGVYDFVWPAGMLLVAYAAWQPWAVHKVHTLTGWRAVALPLACQAVALGTQIWGLIAKLGESERIIAIAVLAVVIVQLYVSRPGREVASDRAASPAPNS